ncbi:MAG TPA: hypothetical protein DHV36_21570 [Desulfobacteraceae bacterium]|nr:hypothetical protein [Desulfobacteraceae bacterium]
MKIIMSGAAAGILMALIACTSVLADPADFHTTADEMIEALTRPVLKFRSLHIDPAGESFAGDPVYETPASGQVMNRAIAVVENEDDTVSMTQVAVDNTAAASRVRTKILFDFNSARVRPESFPLLEEVGVALNSSQLADRPVVISGHADSDGPEDYNLRLSFKRARAVRDYLVQTCEVPAARLLVRGFGEHLPLVAEVDAQAKQRNRRVEFELAR